jgi:hypothetical protein
MKKGEMPAMYYVRYIEPGCTLVSWPENDLIKAVAYFQAAKNDSFFVEIVMWDGRELKQWEKQSVL